MKQPFYKSPTAHKWGLYICLLGSLGFNLSMNPEHTDFARNTHYNVMEFAQTVSPAEALAPPQVNPATTAVASTNAKPISDKIFVDGTSSSYEVQVFQVGKDRLMKLSPVTNGEVCGFCGTYSKLNSQFDDIAAIRNEALTIVRSGHVSKTSETPAADLTPAAPAKPGEALTADIEKLAVKCKEKSDEALMKCHRDQIVKLSSELKNHSDQASIVSDYFDQYLKSDLKSALKTNRTVKTSRLSVLGDDELDADDAFQTYELAHEIVRTLVEKLETKNGEVVRKSVTKMSAESILLQASYARKAMEDSFRGGDVIQDRTQFDSGLAILNGLRNEASDISAGLQDAFDGNKTKKTADISNYRNTLENSFTPMDTMFNDIQQKYFNMGGMIYTKVGVDALKTVSYIPGSINVGPTLPSASGTLPANIGQARAEGRSYDRSGLLLIPQGQQQQTVPGLPGQSTLPGQQSSACQPGFIATVSGCQPSGQQQIPGGYQQNNGLPPPRAAYQIRGSSI